jgi:hypothetical protein
MSATSFWTRHLRTGSIASHAAGWRWSTVLTEDVAANSPSHQLTKQPRGEGNHHRHFGNVLTNIGLRIWSAVAWRNCGSTIAGSTGWSAPS